MSVYKTYETQKMPRVVLDELVKKTIPPSTDHPTVKMPSVKPDPEQPPQQR